MKIIENFHPNLFHYWELIGSHSISTKLVKQTFHRSLHHIMSCFHSTSIIIHCNIISRILSWIRLPSDNITAKNIRWWSFHLVFQKAFQSPAQNTILLSKAWSRTKEISHLLPQRMFIERNIDKCVCCWMGNKWSTKKKEKLLDKNYKFEWFCRFFLHCHLLYIAECHTLRVASKPERPEDDKMKLVPVKLSKIVLVKLASLVNTLGISQKHIFN